MRDVRWGLALAGLAVWPALAVGSQTMCIEMRRAAASLVLVPVEVRTASVPTRKYWFLLDTGSGVTVIDDGVATDLKATPSSRTTVVTASGPIAAIASRVSLGFGSLRVDDLEVVQNPLAEIRAIEPDVRGILGQDVLRRTSWRLDYTSGVVILDPERTLASHPGDERVPLRWIGERPAVDAVFGRGAPMSMVLDSAAAGIVLFRLPRSIDGTATSSYTHVKTLGDRTSAPIVTTDVLRVGSITLPHPSAAVVPQNEEADEAAGVLPTWLFDSLYFDQASGVALISRAASRTSLEGPRRIIRARCEAAGALPS